MYIGLFRKFLLLAGGARDAKLGRAERGGDAQVAGKGHRANQGNFKYFF